jgi:hypothetical protein
MPRFPLRPNLKKYRGSQERAAQKNREYNATARKVAAYLNRLVANNPDTTQQYMFEDIAQALGYSVDDVRSAISNGGYNGITFQDIDEADRRDLAGYKLLSTEDGTDA